MISDSEYSDVAFFRLLILYIYNLLYKFIYNLGLQVSIFILIAIALISFVLYIKKIYR